MKNVFKIFAMTLCAAGIFAFAACSNSSGGGDAPAPTPTAATYTVNFDANDGSQNPAKATQIFTAGTPQNLTTVADLGFKRDGFDFAGWALSSAATKAAYADGAEYTATADATLYAVWSAIPVYTVTFETSGGSEVASQSVTRDQTASKPDDPSKDHFNFVTWCSDQDCQTPFDFTTTITDNITLYAKWSNLPVFEVTFELNGGKYGSNDTYTQNVETGGKATRPASDPTKDDNVGEGMTTKYAFVNWYADSGCSALFDFDATTITGHTTVYAKWNETKYYAVTIASDIQRGTVSSDTTGRILAGTLVSLTESPNPCCEFVSYNVTDEDFNSVTVTDGKFTMPSSPVTVTATFNPVPLTLEAIVAGAEVTFRNQAAGPVTYRVNGGDAQTIPSGSSGSITLSDVGDKVSFYGDNPAYSNSSSVVKSLIGCDKYCYIYGNIMSLVDSENYENAKELTQEYVFSCLFCGNNFIKNKQGMDLFLPATTLTGSCYKRMFEGCTSLVSAPALPATTLTGSCYSCMFKGCTSLVSAPALPATTLASACYGSMFNGCTSLVSAPALPATTLEMSCYGSMFSGCTNLTTAPVLLAEKLYDECYLQMFFECKKLTSITCLATRKDDILSRPLNGWLSNGLGEGTFTKSSKASMEFWKDFIPYNWTVVDYQE